MLLATIQQAVRDSWPSQIPTTKLDRFIASAVRYYSRYNPRVLEGSITTVADQDEYSLSSLTGLIGVQEALYLSTGSPWNDLLASSELLHVLRQPTQYNLISQRVIDDVTQQEHVRATSATWEYREGNNTIQFRPEPLASGSTITITYWAAHAINGAGDAYETIPDEDLEILANLVLAKLLMASRIEAAMEPDYREGLETVTARYVPGNIALTVESLRQSCQFKYGGTAVVTAP